MKNVKMAIALGTGALCAAGLFVLPALAPQDEKAGDAQSMQEQMDQWASMNQLGAEHKKLAELAGTWNAKTSFTMDPSMPSMEGTGTMECEMVLGGRYLQGKFHMDDMMGMPFDGISTMGYDAVDKKYVATWIDSMNTGIYLSKGTMGADGKTLTMVGESVQPDGTKGEMKMVTILHSKDKMEDQMFEQRDGQWVKTGTITYTRQGASANADN